jgi:hypothetical protein
VLVLLSLLLLGAPLLGYARASRESLREPAQAAYRRGLAAIQAAQLETGELPTYAWSVAMGTGRKWPVRSIFTATQALHSLGFEDGGPAARLVRERAVAFLLAHREPPGVWRYFGKGYEVSPGVPLSPDVDDTATAWAALHRLGHPVDAGALALLRASRAEDGLFTTWVGPPSTWTGIDSRQTDLALNANALFLFGLLGEAVPEVCRQVVAHATTGAFARGTPWYPSPLAFAYFLSRAHRDGGAACLAEAVPPVRAWVRARQQPDGGWGDDLETALGLLTLLNTGDESAAVTRGLQSILARQGADGFWALAPHYTTVKAAGEPAVYFGSPVLTTAFCLEALAKAFPR